uniref:Uncharacterized protein n=1 Tax=Anguilla anguilla TaxID=7936 RepID=A0A0E9QGN0_ANGAN
MRTPVGACLNLRPITWAGQSENPSTSPHTSSPTVKPLPSCKETDATLRFRRDATLRFRTDATLRFRTDATLRFRTDTTLRFRTDATLRF